MSVESDRDNLLIKLSNHKSAHPVERQLAFKQKKKTCGNILPFVTTYYPAVRNSKQIVMENWGFIQNQPLPKTIYKKPLIISHKRGKSLKETLVQAKI